MQAGVDLAMEHVVEVEELAVGPPALQEPALVPKSSAGMSATPPRTEATKQKHRRRAGWRAALKLIIKYEIAPCHPSTRFIAACHSVACGHRHAWQWKVAGFAGNLSLMLPREPQKVEVASLVGLEDVLVVELGVATRGPLRARRLGLEGRSPTRQLVLVDEQLQTTVERR